MDQKNEMEASLNIYDVPEEFICPITHQIMLDPVICADEQTYEREACLKLFEDKEKIASPINRSKLIWRDGIISNRSISNTIERYLKEKPEYKALQYKKDNTIDEVKNLIDKKELDKLILYIESNTEKLKLLDEDRIFQLLQLVYSRTCFNSNVFFKLLLLFEKKALRFILFSNEQDNPCLHNAIKLGSGDLITLLFDILGEKAIDECLKIKKSNCIAYALLYRNVEIIDLIQQLFEIAKLNEELQKPFLYLNNVYTVLDLIIQNQHFEDIFKKLMLLIPDYLTRLVANKLTNKSPLVNISNDRNYSSLLLLPSSDINLDMYSRASLPNASHPQLNIPQSPTQLHQENTTISSLSFFNTGSVENRRRSIRDNHENDINHQPLHKHPKW